MYEYSDRFRREKHLNDQYLMGKNRRYNICIKSLGSQHTPGNNQMIPFLFNVQNNISKLHNYTKKTIEEVKRELNASGLWLPRKETTPLSSGYHP